MKREIQQTIRLPDLIAAIGSCAQATTEATKKVAFQEHGWKGALKAEVQAYTHLFRMLTGRKPVAEELNKLLGG